MQSTPKEAVVWRELLGHFRKREWPRSYISFDLETSGFGAQYQFILEIGHCVTVNGAATSRSSVVLNWFDVPGFNVIGLRNELRSLAEEYRKKGSTYTLTEDYIRQHGIDPREALKQYGALFAEARENNLPLVGHNITGFDIPFWCVHGQRLGHAPIAYDPDNVYDTSTLEKLAQLGWTPKSQPRSGESLFDYMTRLARSPIGGIKSSLDKHCAQKYDFPSFGLVKSAAHRADADAYAAHLLMSIYSRQLAMANWDPDKAPPDELPPVRWTVPVAESFANREFFAPPEPPKPRTRQRRY